MRGSDTVRGMALESERSVGGSGVGGVGGVGGGSGSEASGDRAKLMHLSPTASVALAVIGRYCSALLWGMAVPQRPRLPSLPPLLPLSPLSPLTALHRIRQ